MNQSRIAYNSSQYGVPCHRSRAFKDVMAAKTRTESFRHGKSDTPEYRTWCHIKSRCYNPRVKDYSSYGGRGVKVCDRWLYSFDNFFTDMGEKPSDDHSIDRIDSNGDYSPQNCRWASHKKQMNNRRIGRNNNSGFRGVSFFKNHRKWCARISHYKDYIFLGYFDRPEEAALAYDVAAIQLLGKDAKLNLLGEAS